MVAKERIAELVTVAGTLCAAAGALFWWFAAAPEVELAQRDPLPEQAAIRAAAGLAATKPEVNIEGYHAAFDGIPSTLPGTWPQFRGGDGRNIDTDPTPLLHAWADAEPQVLWRVHLGDGHAGPAVYKGRVFILDYDEQRQGDLLRCFSLDDGREIWQRGYAVRIKRNHGISRTVPAVSDDAVLSLGPKCHVLCVEPETGAFLWGLDLVRDFGTKVPLWYAGQCPLIEAGVAVLAPAGTDLLLGIDSATGTILWRTPNPHGWHMSHSSVVTMVVGEQRMFVYCAVGGVVGVAATGRDRGRILWEFAAWNHPVVAPSPVPLDNGQLLLTAGYGAGSLLLQLEEQAGHFTARALARFDKSVFACEQHTPIYYRGCLFTVMPNDAGALRRQLVCFDPASGLRWSSGVDKRFGLGPFCIAGAALFVLRDDGLLTVAEASTERYSEQGQAKLLDGRDAWAPMAVAGSRLLLRDSQTLICLDLRQR